MVFFHEERARWPRGDGQGAMAKGRWPRGDGQLGKIIWGPRESGVLILSFLRPSVRLSWSSILILSCPSGCPAVLLNCACLLACVMCVQGYSGAGARVSSCSWGGAAPASYDSSNQEMDEYIFEANDLLVVIAAGNANYGPVRHSSKPPWLAFLLIVFPVSGGMCRGKSGGGGQLSFFI